MMRRILLALAFTLGLAGAASAADCYGNVAGTQANCSAVQMYLDALGRSIPVTDAAGLPVRIISGGGGGGAVTLPTPPTIAAGNGVVLAPSTEALAGVAPSANTTTGKGLVLKSGAGNLYSLVAKIGATSGYVILADATSIATDGAITYKWCKPVASNGTFGGDDWAWNPPLTFSVGITANFSTTGCATMTGSTTAEFSGQAK